MKKCKAFLWVLVALQLFVIVLTLFTARVDNMTLGNGQVDEFNSGWTVIREDGSRQELESIPRTVDSKAGETIVIENVIPQEFAGKTMFFLSADKTVRVMVDGSEIYSFGVDDERMFGHTPGSVENFVDLPQDLGTGIIRIEMVSPYEGYGGHISAISVASRDTAILHMFRSNMGNLVLNLSMVFSGLLLVLLALLQHISGKNRYGMAYMGAFCFAMSVYCFIETKMLHMLYGNQTLYSVLVFLILMIMPVLFSIYYNIRFQEMYEKRFRCIFILCSINIVTQIILQMLNIFDFMDMAKFSHLLIFITIITIFVSHVQHRVKFPDDGSAPEIVALAFLLFGSMTDLARTYVYGTGDLGKYSRIGAAVYCVTHAIVYVVRITRDYSNSVAQNAMLLQREVETAEEQNRLLSVARDEAEAARREADEANKAKSGFLANMSHEIRTPINAILGMDSMILREAKDQSVLSYARDIQSASRNLLSLINDILDFSKIESGKMDIIEGEYELGDMLNDCYNTVAFKAKDKDLNLTFVNDPGIPRRLYGDEMRVRQIVINILNNAIKYTKEGSVELNVGFGWIDAEHINLVVKVKDTGMGISAENQKKLFTSFQRLDEKNTRTIEGSGLGLTIVKQLLDLMNGSIQVESKYGLGSTFTMTIPQAIFANVPLGEFTVTEHSSDEQQVYRMGFTAPKAKILVVDDVPLNLKVVTALLKETKIQVDTASSGSACLEMVEENHYDIIFLDHLMPQMDGLETMNRMKEMAWSINKDTPVIMLTANALVGAREGYINAGFRDYMSKPIKEAELDDMLLKYLPNEYIMHVEKSNNAADGDKNETPLLERLTFLDTATGMQYSGDSEELYREILEAYLVNDKLAVLQETYVSEDWKNYEIIVHAMKSTSLTIGAVKLSELCRELEMAAKRNDSGYIREHHAQMQHQYEELVLNLKNVLE
jgi:signal transduction histidine kinase/DNA-binding NarL/FixJ family response regulator/HPt (histidine-containing phosphotransfer) domain-containing protein